MTDKKEIILPEKKEPRSTSAVNGKTVPKYIDAFILQSTICQNCKNMIAPNGIAWATSLDQLTDLAERTHSQGVTANKVICVNSNLIIIYALGLLPSALLQQNAIAP